MTETLCPWCGVPFQPVKRGGNVKRFCSAAHKHAFETAARRYAYAMVDAGLLSVAEMKRVTLAGAESGLPPSRATAGLAESASPGERMVQG